MKAVIQRVREARVTVDGEIVGQCSAGLMVLLGVAENDDGTDAELLAQKIVKLRIFCDGDGKMNLSLRDVGGEMLVVSQFTLLADTSHGNRPSFFGAGSPEHARALYEKFVDLVAEQGIPTQTGRFGADMQVSLVNDGPVTLILDSATYRKTIKGKE